jgi:hypothetical protein
MNRLEKPTPIYKTFPSVNDFVLFCMNANVSAFKIILIYDKSNILENNNFHFTKNKRCYFSREVGAASFSDVLLIGLECDENDSEIERLKSCVEDEDDLQICFINFATIPSGDFDQFSMY